MELPRGGDPLPRAPRPGRRQHHRRQAQRGARGRLFPLSFNVHFFEDLLAHFS